MKFETIKNHPLRTAGLALAIGLTALLAGCGDQSGTAPSPEETSKQDSPGIEVEYFDNGSRVIRFVNESGNYSDILGVCDGPDLVEQTEFLKYGYGAAGNAPIRSADHPACADGKLTPADFKIAG